MKKETIWDRMKSDGMIIKNPKWTDEELKELLKQKTDKDFVEWLRKKNQEKSNA